MPYKTIVVTFFGLFCSFVILIQCLGLASHKDFWHDEVYELKEPLVDSPQKMLVNGVYGTPSPSPLYYVIQRQFVRSLLTLEREKGQGFNWRVSLRIFPALALAMSGLAAMLLSLQINWLFAL